MEQNKKAATPLRGDMALAPRTTEARNNLGFAMASLGKLNEAINSLA